MRIQNIKHDTDGDLYELEIIGSKEDIDLYSEWTKYDTDFIEEESDDKWSITVLGDAENKKNFRRFITEDLKEFRKYKKTESLKESKLLVKNFEQFINENKSYISDSELHYTISEEYFKNNDYWYQKLFDANVPYYYKEVGERKIWCGVEDKIIYIGDWYGFLTPTVLKYFIEHRNGENVKYTKTFDYYYLRLKLNRETGEIVIKTPSGAVSIIPKNRDMVMDEDNIYNKEPWTDLVLPIEKTNKILDEINRLTNNKFK